MRFLDRCILWSACVLLFTVCARQTENEQESKLQQIFFPTGIEYRENGTESGGRGTFRVNVKKRLLKGIVELMKAMCQAGMA